MPFLFKITYGKDKLGCVNGKLNLLGHIGRYQSAKIMEFAAIWTKQWFLQPILKICEIVTVFTHIYDNK